MSAVQITTPFNISLDFEIAPFYKRLLAYFIDLFILIMYSLFMRWLLYDGLGIAGDFTLGLDILFVSVPLLLYHLICEMVFHGQSIGKRVMRIRVMSLDGGDPTASQYLLRWFFRVWEWPFVFSFVLPNFLVILQLFLVCALGLIVVIIIAVTQKSQRLGDVAANTVVVDTRINTSIDDTIFREINRNEYKVKYPQVLRLSDRDINTIKNILHYTGRKNDYEAAHRIASTIKSALNIESDQYVTDFLEQLLSDYNYLATKE